MLDDVKLSSKVGRRHLGHLEVRQGKNLVAFVGLPHCTLRPHPMMAPSPKALAHQTAPHRQAVKVVEVPYLVHNDPVVVEFPPDVGTSTDASFRLVRVEVFQSPFRTLYLEGLQISACRLFVGSSPRCGFCMRSSGNELPLGLTLFGERIGSIVLHLTSFGEVRQLIF